MTKNIRKMQVFRHITQVILFFLLPGMYALAFSEFKKIYSMIIDGNFHFIQAFPSLMEFVTVIILTMLLGRFFCGWLCAFGTYNDWIHLLGKKVFKINFKVNEKVDSVLKYMKYVILLMLLIVICTMASNILNNTSPWDAFAQITDLSYVLSDLIIGFILLVLITIGAFFIERFFCRYLCPLGALFTIFSKISIFKIKKPNDKCGKCRICTSSCSMGLPLYKVNNVRGGECINCLKCVDVCPRKNAQANVLGENINPALASSVAIAAFAGIYGLNNFAGTTLIQNGLGGATSVSSSSTTSPSEKYKDGTYTGTGTGFKGGTTTIEVKISKGKILDISTISQQDTPEYYEGTIGTITNEIISAQSTSVDTISGATYSCRGIIEAVQDALKQALEGSSTSTTTASNDSSNENEDNSSTSSTKEGSTSTAPVSKSKENSDESTITPNENSSANNNITNNDSAKTSTDSSTNQEQKYKDGIYTGSGIGFRGGTTEISVTVKDNKITGIETISNQDTPRYYDYVKDIIPNEIISAQSTSVDTVSGATFSCRGIIEAVENALSKAK
jgi:uncharacterized protein with FMN-binding domain